jgi:hypothetical protein
MDIEIEKIKQRLGQLNVKIDNEEVILEQIEENKKVSLAKINTYIDELRQLQVNLKKLDPRNIFLQLRK